MNEHPNHDDRYRQLLDRITDGFIALDKAFCYTYANQKIGELVRRDPKTLIGKNVWEVFPDAVGSYTYRAFHTAMKEQRFISNIDYYAPLDLWQENYIYPSPDGISVFIKDITERKRLEMELKEQERRQQLQMIAAALQAQEQERTHIGRELHDNVNQLLTAARLVLGLAGDNPAEAAIYIERCLQLLEKAINENRKLAHELVSPRFSEESLPEELTRLLHLMLGPQGISFRIEAGDFREAALTEPAKLSVYRIAQEQCTNIVRYAAATSVVLQLRTTAQFFTMTIADNGQGADEDQPASGIGLRNIEARLQLYDGSMQIETRQGKGFSLNITIPLKHLRTDA